MWPWSLCRVEEFHDASMTPVAPSDNPLFSVRNLLSDRRPNLSSSKWGAVSVVVGGSSNKRFLEVEMVRQPSFWIWEKTMVHLDKMVQPRYLLHFRPSFSWKRLEWLKTVRRHGISRSPSHLSMNKHPRLQGLYFRNSKYEIDGLHCLQKKSTFGL